VLLCSASSMKDWWQSQTSSEVIWWLLEDINASWRSERMQILLFL
jgi:hypothetical protein